MGTALTGGELRAPDAIRKRRHPETAKTLRDLTNSRVITQSTDVGPQSARCGSTVRGKKLTASR